MNIQYRGKIRRNYEKINLILNGKCDYLKNLKDKRNNSLKILKEKENDIIIEDLLKPNKLKRDYSCFPFNTPINDSISPIKIHFAHDINYPIKKKENKCLNKKKNLKFNFEDTSIPINNNNYYEFPKSNLPIRYINNLMFSRNKILVNVGKEILLKRNISHNQEKIQ